MLDLNVGLKHLVNGDIGVIIYTNEDALNFLEGGYVAILPPNTNATHENTNGQINSGNLAMVA